MTYFETVSYESENVIWIECNVCENASLTSTWILILIENGIQNVWKPLMDYEILTCSPILHEQEFQLEILTESETPRTHSFFQILLILLHSCFLLLFILH